MRAAGRNIVIVLYCKCYPAEPTQTLEEVIDELIVRQLVLATFRIQKSIA